jgi:hypothetical protein
VNDTSPVARLLYEQQAQWDEGVDIMRTEDLLMNGHLAMRYAEQRMQQVRTDVNEVRQTSPTKSQFDQSETRPARRSFVWRAVVRLQADNSVR